MLSEFLSAQHGSDTVMKSVEQLQKQLDSQQSTIATMTASLSAKNAEVCFIKVVLHCIVIWQQTEIIYLASACNSAWSLLIILFIYLWFTQ
jgi:hypothetical protein